MAHYSSARRGFTLVELLTVVLILGILVSVGVPRYLTSVKASRSAGANSNASTIATSVQAKYIKSLAGNYSGFTGATLQTDAAVLSDLGGTIPKNPCTGGNQLNGVDYLVTPTASTWTITPVAGSCDSNDLKTIVLGS